MDTLLPTFTTTGMTYTALRYSLENREHPLWTASLSDTNVQTFMVVVETN